MTKRHQVDKAAGYCSLRDFQDSGAAKSGLEHQEWRANLMALVLEGCTFKNGILQSEERYEQAVLES